MDPSLGQLTSPQRAIREALVSKKQHSSNGTPSYGFFLFMKVKSVLKGIRFKSVDAVKAKVTELRHMIHF